MIDLKLVIYLLAPDETMYINISQPEQLLHPISYIRKVSGAELKTRA